MPTGKVKSDFSPCNVIADIPVIGLNIIQDLLLQFPFDLDKIALIVPERLIKSDAGISGTIPGKAAGLSIALAAEGIAIKKKSIYIMPSRYQPAFVNGSAIFVNTTGLHGAANGYTIVNDTMSVISISSGAVEATLALHLPEPGTNAGNMYIVFLQAICIGSAGDKMVWKSAGKKAVNGVTAGHAEAVSKLSGQIMPTGMDDITELINAKAELLKSQQLINSVFHTADIGIAVVDEKGSYVKTNDGYNKLFGYASGGLDGKKYFISVPEGMRKDSMKRFKQLLSGAGEGEERVALKKTGEICKVYRTASLIRNSDGSRYLVVTARDISETQKYQQLLQSTEKMMQMAGWEMDPVTERMTCTDEFFNIIEMSKEHFKTISFDEMVEQIVSPESLPLARKMKYETLKLGKNVDFEIPIITPGQVKKWIRVTCTTEHIKSTLTRLSGIIHDITLRKKADLQLERLSLVASKTNNAVFITDEFGKTVWVNESVEKMTGYRMEEMLGKKPGALLQGPGTDRMTVSRMSDRLKQQLPVSEVIRNYKKDGSSFWINMDIAPVINNNKLVNFIGIGVDITELIKAKEEQQLRESLMQQQKIFNAIANKFPDGIIGVLDNRFHYVFVGGSEIKKLGLTEKDFKNQHIFDHLSEESNIEAEPFLKRAFAGERVIFEVDMKGQIYLVNAVPLSGGEDNAQQVLVVLYNITNRKKVEKDLEKALEKERELSELKSRFISMASHEFRTPLSTVLSSAYLIEKYSRTSEQPKREKHLQHIVSSVTMLTDILNDFLSVGKIEEGKIQLKLSRFYIDELVKSLIGDLKNILKKQQKIKYHHLGNPEVTMDASLLKHIIINLISNASKFSPEGGLVEIKTKCKQETLIFIIKDNGMGISKEDQQHLMQRFFRGANAANIQGTGLGLHIVSKYTELMNGTLECKSELEKGTEFKITFNNKIPGYEKDFAH